MHPCERQTDSWTDGRADDSSRARLALARAKINEENEAEI